MQHHDLPLAVRERMQHFLKHHMILRRLISVMRILHMKQLVKGQVFAFGLAQAHQRQVARDRQQPRHRFARRLIARRRLHHAHKRVLHHILRRRRIPKDGQREAVNGGGRLAIQHFQRGSVTLRDAQDERIIRRLATDRARTGDVHVVILHRITPHKNNARKRILMQKNLGSTNFSAQKPSRAHKLFLTIYHT